MVKVCLWDADDDAKRGELVTVSKATAIANRVIYDRECACMSCTLYRYGEEDVDTSVKIHLETT